MKPIFYRKRKVVRLEAGGSMVVQTIRVRGFTTDRGDKTADIVISAMTGSHRRPTKENSQSLCDALNKVWMDFYSGTL
jgi:hypothetical protein